MQHETDNALEHQVNQLVENRLYEVSITVKGRAGEGRPSRTLTVTPMAKSKQQQKIVIFPLKFLEQINFSSSTGM